MTSARKVKVEESYQSCGKLSSVVVNKQSRTDQILDMANANPCNMCVKSFKYSSQLARHKLTHTEGKNHKCAEDSPPHSQRGEASQMCTMRPNLQSSSSSEEALADTQWGKDAHMFRMQQIIRSSWNSKGAPVYSQWREVAQMC